MATSWPWHARFGIVDFIRHGGHDILVQKILKIYCLTGIGEVVRVCSLISLLLRLRKHYFVLVTGLLLGYESSVLSGRAVE